MAGRYFRYSASRIPGAPGCAGSTGAGLGTRLMTDLLALAYERGLQRLDLEVQDGAGLGAFFTRFGFAEWGRRPGWILSDANDERDEVVLGVTL